MLLFEYGCILYVLPGLCLSSEPTRLLTGVSHFGETHLHLRKHSLAGCATKLTTRLPAVSSCFYRGRRRNIFFGLPIGFYPEQAHVLTLS